jgi:hypothetical protein
MSKVEKKIPNKPNIPKLRLLFFIAKSEEAYKP